METFRGNGLDRKNVLKKNCVKSVPIRSFPAPYFPPFRREKLRIMTIFMQSQEH